MSLVLQLEWRGLSGAGILLWSLALPRAFPSGVQEPYPGSLCPPGVRMGSLGLFLQCAISLLFSLIMDRLVQRFGTRAVYLASVVAFPVATGATCLSRNVAVVTASAALTGFTFSALQILPYTLASLYHREKQVGGAGACMLPASGVRGPGVQPGLQEAFSAQRKLILATG